MDFPPKRETWLKNIFCWCEIPLKKLWSLEILCQSNLGNLFIEFFNTIFYNEKFSVQRL